MTTDYASSQSHVNKTISSSFLRTVCLQDWWLIKAEKDFDGKRLAIGGLTSKQCQVGRVFSSAPIIKRYDIFTLETADGINVMIKGFINRSRTHQHGFPDEVCNHFLIGFPYDWEAYAGEYFGNESNIGGIPSECSVNVEAPACPNMKSSSSSNWLATFSEETPNKNKKAKSKQEECRNKQLNGNFNNDTGPSSDKVDGVNGIPGQSESRRSCYRARSLKIKFKEGQTTNSSQEVSDFVKSVVNNIDCKSGGKSAFDWPDAGPQDTNSESLLKDHDSGCHKHVSKNCLLSSTTTDARQEPTNENSMGHGEAKSSNLNQSFRSLIGSADCTNELKNTVGNEKCNFHDISMSGRKTKRKLVSTFSQERKHSSIVSPECLSFRRSRSGRLLVPTLEFWHNEQVVYDADGQITGIQKGLPTIETSAGSRSHTQEKKKKRV
ncbi:PREDICTED: uncharacterized protein LOC104594582 isoform X2 [Nelumbo nucifera]|uniref:Uncharacterized protein LOC104594582 isoform X2 n=1 Tax=Nelumbo nucifera TaxID=4432 RepID=A0A1U7ZVZ7_NELNU|nr:PREDICTED: uncharacterized protein LOC104594582 isoform X2 [Nelumbo nucifera]